MTDQYVGYVITLEDNIREDEAAQTIAALNQIKGVLSVQPIINNPELMVATTRAQHVIRDKLYKLVFEDWITHQSRVERDLSQ